MAELGVVATVVAQDAHPAADRTPLTLVPRDRLAPAGRAPDRPPAVPVLRVAVLPRAAGVLTEPQTATVVQLADLRARRAARP